MDKKKIDEIIAFSKQEQSTTKKIFDCLDAISEFLKKDKKFFAFVKSRVKNNYISPTEMFVLCYDYLNNTGKYAEYLDKKKTSSKQKSNNKAKEKAPKKEIKKIDIFDLDF